MCEEMPAVTALNFLQNDIFTTVDHNDQEETSIFRSLLAHLLVPSTSSALSTSHQSGSHKADECEESDAPPKKRSRQSTPQELLTSKLDQDQMMSEAAPFNSAPHSNHNIVSMEEDPEERVLRGGKDPLTAARFKQRTEVFESLLRFIDDEAKQPPGNLLDKIERMEEV